MNKVARRSAPQVHTPPTVRCPWLDEKHFSPTALVPVPRRVPRSGVPRRDMGGLSPIVAAPDAHIPGRGVGALRRLNLFTK